MIGCLHDRTLVRLVCGEGNARQRRHVLACLRCGERHAAIRRARDVAGSVLREAMVRPVGRMVLGRRDAMPLLDRRGMRMIAPLAAATALAAGLVLVLRVPTMRPTATTNIAAELSLDDVADAFTLEDSGAWLAAGADDVRWEAALGGERVCETEDGFWDPQCD